MEKLGQLHARRRSGRQLRPDRRRHAAVALRPGLPRRAGAAVVASSTAGSIRMLLAPARGPARLHDGRPRAWSPTRCEDPRRPVAQRPADVRGRVRHALRRLPGARPADLRRSCRPAARRSSSSRRPRPTRCARRRTSSSGSTRTRCRWPAWSSTGASPAAAGVALGRRGDGGVGAARRDAPSADGPSLTAGLLRLHADRRAAGRARGGAAATGSPPRTRRSPTAVVAGAGRRRARPRRRCAASAGC